MRMWVPKFLARIRPSHNATTSVSSPDTAFETEAKAAKISPLDPSPHHPPPAHRVDKWNAPSVLIFIDGASETLHWTQFSLVAQHAAGMSWNPPSGHTCGNYVAKWLQTRCCLAIYKQMKSGLNPRPTTTPTARIQRNSPPLKLCVHWQPIRTSTRTRILKFQFIFPIWNHAPPSSTIYFS